MISANAAAAQTIGFSILARLNPFFTLRRKEFSGPLRGAISQIRPFPGKLSYHGFHGFHGWETRRFLSAKHWGQLHTFKWARLNKIGEMLNV
ncbi:MAG: hypothetical protein ABSH38_23635 [Verrucomicrobiota bacterium]